MILLLNPMWSVPERANFDSGFVHHSITCAAIAKKRPDWLIVWLWPERDSFRYYDDGFFKRHANIVRVPYPGPTAKMTAALHFDALWWLSKFSGEAPPMSMLPADIIWNNVVESGHLLRDLINTYDDKAKPIVVNSHNFVIHPTLPNAHGLEHIRRLQVHSFFGVDFNVFNSKHCHEMLLDNVREYHSRQFVEDNMPDAQIIIHGLIDAEHFERMQQPRFDEFSFVYNHRLEGYKNWETTFAVFARLWDEGFRFKVYVTGVDAKHFTRLSHLPFVEFRTDLASRDDYLRFLSKCHANVTNSQHETYCISAVESLCMGHTLVAPNAVTFPELVPAGYRWLFDNVDDQLAKLRWLLQSPPAVNPDAVADLRRRFSADAYADTLIDLFERLAGKRLQAMADRVINHNDFLPAIQALPDVMPFAAAFRAVKQITGFRSQVCTPNRVKRILNVAGFVECWENGHLAVRKAAMPAEPDRLAEQASGRP